MNNFIPTNIKSLCTDKKISKNDKVIIYPFTSNNKNKIKNIPINSLPKVFNKSEPINITEFCYRDTFMQDNTKNIIYFKKKRMPLVVNSFNLIEIEKLDKISEDCFPILRKYDVSTSYKRYEYNVNKCIMFVAIEINSVLYFQIEICDVQSQSESTLKKINDFLNKNIAKYKVSNN